LTAADDCTSWAGDCLNVSRLARVLAEHLGKPPNFAQFIPTLIVGDFRSVSNLEHAAAAYETQSTQQEFPLSVRQFQLHEIAHRILVRWTNS
jgi:hypothetical protein